MSDVEASAFGAKDPDDFTRRIIRWTRKMPENWLGKRIAFLLRKIAILRLRGEPVDVEAMGARFRLYPFNNVCEKRILFTPQYFDAAERAMLAAHVAQVKAQGRPYHFIDIGANVGGYSLAVAAQAQGAAKILAVEPQPDVFDRLCFNIAANPGCKVKAIAAAVADRNGELTLFLDARNKGESSVRRVGFEPGRGSSVTVPARTLQHLMGEEGFDRLDAMKLDVEGAEDLILVPFFREAPESLWPDLVVIEDGRDSWPADLVGLFEKSGYKVLSETRLNLILARGAAQKLSANG